ncbi:MAG TPA: energy-coupling factor transporter transmembrane component T [Acetivibrio sp.]|nr:energy-coupling factor transporter transmembrane component T [Acetivibrio sp.]HPT90742.1 energy-coupling factor transporter transmembrane component T [Acetivibrio sp.]
MVKDITLGQYIPGNSLIHRADPRVKLILTFILMTTIMIVKSYTAFLMIAGLILVTVFSGKIPFVYTLKGLKPIMPVVIFTALINIFTTEGTVLYGFKFIHITYEGLDMAAKTSLRIVTLIIGTSIMLLTTTPLSLTDGIERLLYPLSRIGLPVHKFAMMMNIALRFIPTLLEETDKVMKAQASRGVDFETGGIIERGKNFIPVLVPLFVSALRRADELAVAMEARCYNGGKGRTRMKQLKLTKVDLQITLVLVVFEFVLLYVQYVKMPV